MLHLHSGEALAEAVLIHVLQLPGGKGFNILAQQAIVLRSALSARPSPSLTCGVFSSYEAASAPSFSGSFSCLPMSYLQLFCI